jgi:threonine aldolase
MLLHEQEGFQELCGMSAVSLPTDGEIGMGLHAEPLLYRHVLAQAKDDYLEGVSTVILELPHRELGGKLTPWQDIVQLQQLCKDRGIAFHCDGARIFEATTGYQQSLPELVKPFDSVYVSFYKGLGGLSGAMLLGPKDFCDEARIWLRRFGGNLYTLLPYAVSGSSGYQKYWKDAKQRNNLTFLEKKEKLVRVAKVFSSEESIISQVVTLEPPVPQVNMVHLYLRPSLEDCNRIRDQVQEQLGVSIFHRIRAIEEDDPAFEEGFRSKFELSIGQANGSVPDNVWIQAWTEFCKAAVVDSKLATTLSEGE